MGGHHKLCSKVSVDIQYTVINEVFTDCKECIEMLVRLITVTFSFSMQKDSLQSLNKTAGQDWWTGGLTGRLD